MGETKSYKELSQFQPGRKKKIFIIYTKYKIGSNLISFPVLFSVIGQTLLQIGFQFYVYERVIRQSWYYSSMDYHRKNEDSDDPLALVRCFENTSLFLFANMQYVAQCIIFSIGKPFRRSFFTNKPLTIWSIILVLFNFYILVYPEWPYEIWIKVFWVIIHNLIELNLLQLKLNYKPYFEDAVIPRSWLIELAVLSIINSFVNYMFERYGVLYVTRAYRTKKRQILKRYRMPENPYLQDQENS